MKQVHWQLPFASLNGTQYRIDIYAEGAPTEVKTLVGAAEPFVTDEDNSDDFFAPVRGQTGVIRIVDESGELMEELLPSDNIDRPVRLVRVSDEAVMWQGFLSCEAYSQEYTSRPSELSLNVNSVLEAMSGVEVDILQDMLFNSMLSQLVYCMKTVEDKAGIPIFRNIHITGSGLLYKYIYINSLFEADEVVSGESVTYDIHSVSCKKILSIISEYFGFNIRERGMDIYITNCSVSDRVRSFHFSDLVDDMREGCVDTLGYDDIDTSTVLMSEFDWMGTDHRKTIHQGARRVITRAKVMPWELRMKVPSTPYSWLVGNPEGRWPLWGEVYANDNKTFHSQCTFRALRTTMQIYKTAGPEGTTIAYSLQYNGVYTGKLHTHSIPWESNDFVTYYKEIVQNQTKAGSISLYPSSYLCLYRSNTNNEMKEALVLNGIPGNLRYGNNQYRQFNKFALSSTNYIYRQVLPLPFSAGNGWINIKASIGMAIYNNGKAYTGIYNFYKNAYITCALQFGDKWWNGTDWSSSFATFLLEFDNNGQVISNKDETIKTKETTGLFIPIEERMTGEISFMLYHEIGAWQSTLDTAFAFLFDNMEVSFAPVDEDLKSNRSENGYIKNLSGSFKDVQDYSVSLVSDAHNDPSANMLYESNATPCKFDDSEFFGMRRPELKLLDKLASYYENARTDVEVEVGDLIENIPMVRVTGYDRKTYLPLSESREWKTGVSTIRCFEAPEG